MAGTGGGTGSEVLAGFFGGRPGRRLTGVASVTGVVEVGLVGDPFSTAGVDTAIGRILGLPELRFPFPENESKSLLEEDEDEEER